MNEPVRSTDLAGPAHRGADGHGGWHQGLRDAADLRSGFQASPHDVPEVRPPLAAVVIAASDGDASFVSLDAAGHVVCRVGEVALQRINPESTMPANQSSSQDEVTDAIELLTEDHTEVDEMFEAYQDLVDSEADGEAKAALAEQICDVLSVHATIEEEIFYPAARLVLEEEELLDQAQVEHASVKDLVAQIRDMEPDEELYDAKVKVLGEYVKHHVEEEEGELFQQLRDTDFDAEDIGERLLERKQELMAEQGIPEEA